MDGGAYMFNDICLGRLRKSRGP